MFLETVSGSAPMDFTRINLTNVYRGLDNVVLVVRPKTPEDATTDEEGGGVGSDGAAHRIKGLLIASHYDSAVCSTGESWLYRLSIFESGTDLSHMLMHW